MYERKRINAKIKTPEGYIFPDQFDFGGVALDSDKVTPREWYCKFNMLDRDHWECYSLLPNGERSESVPSGKGETPEKAFEALVRIISILGVDSVAFLRLFVHLREYFEEDGYPNPALLEEVYQEQLPDELVMPEGLAGLGFKNMGIEFDVDGDNLE